MNELPADIPSLTSFETTSVLQWAEKRGFLAGSLTADMVLACLLSEKANTEGEVICDTSVRG